MMPFSRQQIPRLPSAPISPTIGWIAANSQGTVAEAPVAVLLRRLGFSAWRKPFASCFHRPGIGNPQHPLPTTRRIISKGRHVKHLVVGQGERCLPPNHRPRRQTQRNRICRRRGALRNMMDPARTGPRCLWSPPRLQALLPAGGCSPRCATRRRQLNGKVRQMISRSICPVGSSYCQSVLEAQPPPVSLWIRTISDC